MKIRYCLIVFLFFLVACGDCLKDFFIKDRDFSMKAIPYTGNELKINGYYYKNKDKDNEYSRVMIFYANGILLNVNISTVEIEDRLKATDFTKRYRDCMACWGPFNINNSVFQFEFYAIFGNNWHTCIAHCKILNDTTFNIENITFSKTGKVVEIEDFPGKFHFKQFSPKPDSTNNIIK